MLTRHSIAALLTLALSAASARAAIVTPVTDPSGDAFNGGTHDILSIEGGVVGTDLVLTLQFADPITRPSDIGGTRPLIGVIAIDFYTTTPADMSAAVAQLLAGFQSPLPAGIDYFIDLGSEGFAPFGLLPGEVSVTNSVPADVGIALASYAGNILTIQVPLGAIGNPNLLTTNLAFGAVVGDFSAPTDVAALATVPEPTSLAAWSLLGLATAQIARRRKRA